MTGLGTASSTHIPELRHKSGAKDRGASMKLSTTVSVAWRLIIEISFCSTSSDFFFLSLDCWSEMIIYVLGMWSATYGKPFLMPQPSPSEKKVTISL